MKAEELMAGDWVRITEPDKLVGAKARIHLLHDLFDGAYFRVMIQDKDFGYHLHEVFSDDIEPIPLTPEILEKNGFKIDFEDGSLIWVDEQNVTEVVWGGTILTIHGENGHLELDTCMYVHELQHALRICGIEKEISIC